MVSRGDDDGTISCFYCRNITDRKSWIKHILYDNNVELVYGKCPKCNKFSYIGKPDETDECDMDYSISLFDDNDIVTCQHCKKKSDMAAWEPFTDDYKFKFGRCPICKRCSCLCHKDNKDCGFDIDDDRLDNGHLMEYRVYLLQLRH